MDRDGVLIQYLDDHLPNGLVVDIGAGNGFTAAKLDSRDRKVVACEPSAGLTNSDVSVNWLRGSAQHYAAPVFSWTLR